MVKKNNNENLVGRGGGGVGAFATAMLFVVESCAKTQMTDSLHSRRVCSQSSHIHSDTHTHTLTYSLLHMVAPKRVDIIRIRTFKILNKLQNACYSLSTKNASTGISLCVHPLCIHVYLATSQRAAQYAQPGSLFFWGYFVVFFWPLWGRLPQQLRKIKRKISGAHNLLPKRIKEPN